MLACGSNIEDADADADGCDWLAMAVVDAEVVWGDFEEDAAGISIAVIVEALASDIGGAIMTTMARSVRAGSV